MRPLRLTQSATYTGNFVLAYTAFEAAHAAYGPAAYPCEIWKLEHGARRLVAQKLPPAFGKV